MAGLLDNLAPRRQPRGLLDSGDPVLDLWHNLPDQGGGNGLLAPAVSSGHSRDVRPGEMLAGRMVPPGTTEAMKEYANLVSGFVGSLGTSRMPIRAYHGAAEDFSVFDPARFGSGATGRFFAGTPRDPAFYLTTSERHAAEYGTPLAFDISGRLLRSDARREIAQWAKENGYRRPQEMIDRMFDGDAYQALNADHFFIDQLRNARAKGLPGALVDFGDLTSRNGNLQVPLGKIIILGDPSAATRVR